MSGNGEVKKVEVGETSRHTVEDKIFVAVDEEHGRSTLLWALQNLAKDGATIMIAHVHRPTIRIPAVGIEADHTRMNQQVVDAKRKKKLAKANKKLDEYATICRIRKVITDKVIIEKDAIAKGLEELIVSHGITKLVMGAAADEHYSEEGVGQTNVFATPPSPTEEALRKAEHDLLSAEEALHKAKRDLLYAQKEMKKYKTGQNSGILLVTQVLSQKRAEELARKQRYIEILEAKLENLLSEADDSSVKVSAPSYFICSITQDVMKDPHIVQDGTSYEGKDIRKWLVEDGKRTSPITNVDLPHNVLIPNTALRLAIEDWQKQQRQQARSGGGGSARESDDHSANSP